MQLSSPAGVIQIVNEPTYSLSSTDNVRCYPLELQLAGGAQSSSIHGVLLNDEPVAVISNGGGASGVHQHSAVFKDGLLYLAVGDSVVCLSLEPVRMVWSLKVDSATCFGIHFDERRSAFISHGELEIARFSAAGEILWSESGADIFSERCALHPQFVEAMDFNGQIYRFRYEDGLPASP